MMKISSKLVKSAVTLLSLITLIGTTIPIVATPTTIQAKKAKKKHYVTAKNKHQFKFGYAYIYNKKKHCYIGHKMSKKERQQFNMPKEQKIQKAKSNYDVPKISNFTDKILDKYNLQGDRWANIKITYNDNNLSIEQQNIIEQAIEQINQLNIITIDKAIKTKANITFKLSNNENTNNVIGHTDINDEGQIYKGLITAKTATVTLNTKGLNKYTGYNYKLKLNEVTLHELGHALGLDHNDQSKHEIMQPNSDTKSMKKINSTHVAIDQDYINGLAILYQN